MIGINDACEILSWAYNNNIEIWLDGGRCFTWKRNTSA